MKTTKTFLIAALLGTVLVGCQKEQGILKPESNPAADQIWKISVQLSKPETKALTLDTSGANDKITASWKKGEKVAVYFGGSFLGTLEVTSDDNINPATLSGTVSKPSNLAANDELMLLFPGREDNLWTYLGQDGTAPSATGTMATLFDYTTATLKVESIDTANTTINIDASASSDTFATQQSVFRFGFKVGGSGDNIAVKSLSLSASAGELVRSYSYQNGNWTAEKGPITFAPASGITDNIYYMSVCNENTAAEDFTFQVVGSSDNALYEGVKTIPANAHGVGKLISARNISVSQKSMAPASGSISVGTQVL